MLNLLVCKTLIRFEQENVQLKQPTYCGNHFINKCSSHQFMFLCIYHFSINSRYLFNHNIIKVAEMNNYIFISIAKCECAKQLNSKYLDVHSFVVCTLRAIGILIKSRIISDECVFSRNS
ncbi:unnamed protein product [Acanthoscelides obtectus]|uniref:Uncharacterized protein n=1 Tax=Acanthoscelides obtectus TaxID=200917 RepID=A0A9P0LUS5_ACAOB|nr:unnamed protein product [Acanthoscelides obtectus]CAK1635473.1 hypothetical protein AOBTE_LOCUS9291 [Acanthoscelides obtectus]